MIPEILQYMRRNVRRGCQELEPCHFPMARGAGALLFRTPAHDR